jgi:ADP-ribose pyrophosphatase
LENDVKFVMSKLFDESDLPRLRAFEEWLVDHRIPPDIDELPDNLKFVKWDLRFRKILSTIRSIRQACFGLKDDDDWVVYRIALLRYALHTLSFDERRDRGECGPAQLVHALFSAQSLIYDLVADDFHLKIRAERPPSYPERQRISIDEAPWPLDCPNYDPPYHVDETVLAASRLDDGDGWADPEDVSLVAEASNVLAAKRRDDAGRPLSRRGRTGIAGRGLLGLWGRNLAAAAVVTRGSGTALELLLGSFEDRGELELVKGFVLAEEKAPDAVVRVLETETGWRPTVDGEEVFQGYTYDIRQTDHAWVETKAFLFALGPDAPALLEPGGIFEDVKWYPLTAHTINQVPSAQARLIREAIERLRDAGTLDDEQATELLARTG